MKPLSEWTVEDLEAELTHPRASGSHQSGRRAAVLAELLRRKERETIERCAKECDTVADSHGRKVEQLSPGDIHRVVHQGGWSVACQIAAAIRGLQ